MKRYKKILCISCIFSLLLLHTSFGESPLQEQTNNEAQKHRDLQSNKNIKNVYISNQSSQKLENTFPNDFIQTIEAPKENTPPTNTNTKQNSHANKENLDYLLEDSTTKYPVSDYIWQKERPKQDVKNYFNSTKHNKPDTSTMKIVGYDSYGNPIYQDSYGNLYDSKGSKINKTLKQFMQEEKERLQKERLKLEHERKKQEQERLRKERLQKEQQEKANANKVISTQSSKNAQSKGTPKKNTNTKANSFSQGNKNGTQRELSPEEREALFQTSQRKRNPLLDEYGISEEEFHLYYNINEDEYYYLMNETGQDSYNSNTKKHSANFFRDSILGQRSTIQTKDADDTKFGDSHFSNQENIDEATNEHKLYRTILAGKLIPAILLTPISSEIEGLVQAQIEQDIYANMGRAVLIPRGSKVLGFYKNDNDVGQSRLQITWREIITPQGVNILLTNAVANDSEGYAGAKGHLNNKYWEKYGMGITLQTLANALTFSISNLTQQPNAGITSQYYAGQILSQSQNDINSVLKQIIAKQSQIKPVITIKAGSRIYITPTAHIWFPIPKNNETMAKYYEEEE